MTVTVVQKIINNGPNPGSTQLPNGLTTPTEKPLTPGNTLVGAATCATFGGPHTSWGASTALGNLLMNATSCIGGQGNLSTDQQTDAYYGKVTKGGNDSITTLYKGGDLDWQAALFFELEGLGDFIDKRESIQSGVAPGAGVVNNGAPFQVTADMLPCYAIAFCQNISELGQHYTPSTGVGVSHYGNWWTFPGEGQAGLPNLCVGCKEITAVGPVTMPFNNQSTVAEDFQTVTMLFKEAVAVTKPVPTDVSLDAAQVAALAAGTPVSIASPLIRLVPPAASATPPVVTPPVTTPPTNPPSGVVAPPLAVMIAQNGKVNPAWVQDYTYQATDARADTADGGYGNPACIKVVTTGAYGGFLPSNLPGASTDFSECTNLTVALSAPKGNTYNMYAVMGGDVPVANSGFSMTKTRDGYEVFTTPKDAVFRDANGDHSSAILKCCIQSKQGTVGDEFLIDNWGGVKA